MIHKDLSLFTITVLFLLGGCKDINTDKNTASPKTGPEKDSVAITEDTVHKKEEEKKDTFRLTEDNAIEFFFNYNKTLRSEEHTSELQSRENLVCRLLLEKKNKED